jgi:hypothetical protein
MQYYTFMLDDEAAKCVVIVTPFGKWHRVRVPMGYIGSTDWVQAVMEDPFNIETDAASDYQLGAVIKQHGHPIAFFSRKLTGAQQNYMTVQKELLSIFETLTPFRLILLGSQLHIWTNHANLMYTNITSQQVLCWQLYIKENAPKIHRKAGKENIEADTLSCYPCLERESKYKQLFFEELLLKSF